MEATGNIPPSQSWKGNRNLTPSWGRTARLSLQYREEGKDPRTVSRYSSPTLHSSYSTIARSSSSPTFPSNVTPFLEVAVQKLETMLPEFCQVLGSDAAPGSHRQASEACILLDSPLTIADSPKNSPSTSPKTIPVDLSPVSPQSPTLLHWLSSGPQGINSSGHQSSTNRLQASSTSTLAMEGDWDKYIAPCICWAGAEFLYSDCVWLSGLTQESPHTSYGASNLINLYVYIVKDLQLVKEVICDPFFEGGTTPRLTSLDVSVPEKVAHWLHLISHLCQVRASLISWLSTSLRNVSDLTGLDEIVKLLDDLDDINGTDSPKAFSLWKTRLEDECQLWRYVVQAKLALESCQFADAILNLRKWKRCLSNQPPTTRLETWLQQSHQELLSLLPIYFDRVNAFAGPLYGFDTGVLKVGREPRQDHEGLFLDFLRRQEKAGGPPTAVCLVIDGIATDNLQLERGFCFAEETALPARDEDSVSGHEQLQRQWPPVYLRSTSHLAAAMSTRSSAGHSSSASLLRKHETRSSWTGSESPKTSGKKRSSTNWTVLEYGPDRGRGTSFPHSEWESLVALLRSDSEDASFDPITARPIRMTAHPFAVSFFDERETHGRESLFSVDDAASLFSIGPTNSGDSFFPDSPRQSSFHVVSVSKFISLVVIVKAEEESRWHRRRGRLRDDQIRQFLDDAAAKLRVTNALSEIPDPPLSIPNSLTLNASTPQTWDEEAVRDVLRRIKNSFDLRSIPAHDTLRNSLARNSPNMSRFHPAFGLRNHQEGEISPSKSASAFFLGPELALILDPS